MIEHLGFAGSGLALWTAIVCFAVNDPPAPQAGEPSPLLTIWPDLRNIWLGFAGLWLVLSLAATAVRAITTGPAKVERPIVVIDGVETVDLDVTPNQATVGAGTYLARFVGYGSAGAVIALCTAYAFRRWL